MLNCAAGQLPWLFALTVRIVDWLLPQLRPPGCGLIDPLHPFQIAQSSNSTSNSRDELTQSNLLVSWSLILPEHHWNHNSTQHCTGSHSDHSIDHCPIQHKCDRPLSIWGVSYWMFLGFFSSASACLWSSDSHTYSLIRSAGQNCEHRLECVYLQIRGGPFGPLPFCIQIPAEIFEDPYSNAEWSHLPPTSLPPLFSCLVASVSSAVGGSHWQPYDFPLLINQPMVVRLAASSPLLNFLESLPLYCAPFPCFRESEPLAPLGLLGPLRT